MKGDRWKGIAYLAVLAGLAIGLSLLFRGQRPPPVVTLPTVATATCTPTPTMPPPPTATPGPRHLSAAVEVQTPEGFIDLMDLEGDTAVGRINVNGENQIVLIDLVSGDVRQISSAVGTAAKYSAHISDRWVVWSEYAELADRSLDRRLKVYDREQEREFTLKDAAPDWVDLSGNVVVWKEWGGWENNWDVIAYDLRIGETLTIAKRPEAQLFPRISGPWVIYLDLAGHSAEEKVADLWAYHLASGEDFVLGQVSFPGDASTGMHHVISEGKVVWTTCAPDPNYECQLVGVDLNGSRDEYFVTIPGFFAFAGFFGDILVSYGEHGVIELYDLERGQPPMPIDLPALEDVVGFSISGNRVVWSTWPDDKGPSLYMALIEY